LKRRRLSCVSFRNPNLPSEGHQGNIQGVEFKAGLEHDGNAVASATVADEPTVKRRRKPHPGSWVRGDFFQMRVDLIKTSGCCGKVALRCLNDVVDQF